MKKYKTIALVLVLVQFATNVLSHQHKSTEEYDTDKPDAKKSIIPRHESDTKYGALYEVVEPQEEIRKRSQFGQNDNSISHLHELENFLFAQTKSHLHPNHKKSKIIRDGNALSSKAIGLKATHVDSKDLSKRKNLAFLKNIIEKITKDEKFKKSDFNSTSPDIESSKSFLKKKQVIESANTQNPEQGTPTARSQESATSQDDTPYASSPSNPGLSCFDIFQKFPKLPSGSYWIQTADGKEKMKIHCQKVTNGTRYEKPKLHSGKEWKPLEPSDPIPETKNSKKIVHPVVGDHVPMGDSPYKSQKSDPEPDDPDQLKSGMWPYDSLKKIVPDHTEKNKTDIKLPALPLPLKVHSDVGQPVEDTSSENKTSGNVKHFEEKKENSTANETQDHKNESNASNETLKPTSLDKSSNLTNKSANAEQTNQNLSSIPSTLAPKAAAFKQESNSSSLDSTLQPTKSPMQKQIPTREVTPLKPTLKQAKRPDTLEEFENERDINNSAKAIQNPTKGPTSNDNMANNLARIPSPSTTASVVDNSNFGLLGDIPAAAARHTAPSIDEKDKKVMKQNESSSVSAGSQSQTSISTQNKTDNSSKAENVTLTNETSLTATGRKNMTENESANMTPENRVGLNITNNQKDKQSLNNSTSSNTTTPFSSNETKTASLDANAKATKFNETLHTPANSSESMKPGLQSNPKQNETLILGDNVLNAKASYQYIENKTATLDNSEYHEALGQNLSNPNNPTEIKKKEERKQDESILAQNLRPLSNSSQAGNNMPSSSEAQLLQQPTYGNIHPVIPMNPVNSVQTLAALPLSQAPDNNKELFDNSRFSNKSSEEATSLIEQNQLAGGKMLNSSLVVGRKGEDGTISEAPLMGSPNADVVQNRDQHRPSSSPLTFFADKSNKGIYEYDIYDVGKKKSLLTPARKSQEVGKLAVEPKRSNRLKGLNEALRGTNLTIHNGVSTQLTFKSNIPSLDEGKIVNEEKRSVIPAVNSSLDKNAERRSWEKALGKISDSVQGSNLSIQNNVDSRLTFKSYLPSVKILNKIGTNGFKTNLEAETMKLTSSNGEPDSTSKNKDQVRRRRSRISMIKDTNLKTEALKKSNILKKLNGGNKTSIREVNLEKNSKGDQTKTDSKFIKISSANSSLIQAGKDQNGTMLVAANFNQQENDSLKELNDDNKDVRSLGNLNLTLEKERTQHSHESGIESNASSSITNKTLSHLLVENISNHSVNEGNVLNAIFNVHLRKNESDSNVDNSSLLTVNNLKEQRIDNDVLHAVFNTRERAMAKNESTETKNIPLVNKLPIEKEANIYNVSSSGQVRAKITQKAVKGTGKIKASQKHKANHIEKDKKGQNSFSSYAKPLDITNSNIKHTLTKLSSEEVRKSTKMSRKQRKHKHGHKRGTLDTHHKNKMSSQLPQEAKSGGKNVKEIKKGSKKHGKQKKLRTNRKMKLISKKKNLNKSSQQQIFMKRGDVSVEPNRNTVFAESRQLIPTQVGEMEPSKEGIKVESDGADMVTKNSDQPAKTNGSNIDNKTSTVGSLYGVTNNSTQDNKTSVLANKPQNQSVNPGLNTNSSVVNPSQINNTNENQQGDKNPGSSPSNIAATAQEPMPDLNQILNFTVGFLNKTFYDHYKGMEKSKNKNFNIENSTSLVNNNSATQVPQMAGSDNSSSNAGNSSSNNANNSSSNNANNSSNNNANNSSTSNANNSSSNNTNLAVQALQTTQNQTDNSTAGKAPTAYMGGNAAGSLPEQQNKSLAAEPRPINVSNVSQQVNKIPGIASAAAVSDMMSPVENYILNMINETGAQHFGNGTDVKGKRDANVANKTASNVSKLQDDSVESHPLDPSNVEKMSKYGNLHVSSNQFSIKFRPKKEKENGSGKNSNDGPNSKLLNAASKKEVIQKSAPIYLSHVAKTRNLAKNKRTKIQNVNHRVNIKERSKTLKKNASTKTKKMLTATKLVSHSNHDNQQQIDKQFSYGHKQQQIVASTKGKSSLSTLQTQAKIKKNKKNGSYGLGSSASLKKEKVKMIFGLAKGDKHETTKKTTNQGGTGQSAKDDANSTSQNGFPIKIDGNKIDWGPVSQNWPNFGLG